MILSRRERLIIAATLIAVAALVLDRYAVTPLLDARDAAEVQKQGLLDEMDRGRTMLASEREIGPKWQKMVAAGLRRDPTEAESQVLHAVGDWAMEAGLRLSSLKPDRAPEKKHLQEINFQATGTGSMNAVSRFLWRVETAGIPIRVKELQLGSRKEGTDDLTLQLRLSTIYQAGRPAAPSEAGVPGHTTGGDE
jgi:Tfp pilus assembly protein PilO